MDDDEYVETSDVEELEEIRAREKSDALYAEDDIYLRDDSHSPRKRVKLSSLAEEIAVSQSVPVTPSRAAPLFSSPSSTPFQSQSSATAINRRSYSLTPSGNITSGLVFPTPSASQERRTSTPKQINTDSFEDAFFANNSQDPLLLRSLKREQSPSPLYNSSDASHSVTVSPGHAQDAAIFARTPVGSPLLEPPSGLRNSPTSTPTPSPDQPKLRSRSADPLSLFSSPIGQTRTISRSPSTVSRVAIDSTPFQEDSELPLFTPRKSPSPLPQLSSSPLTPPPATHRHISFITSPTTPSRPPVPSSPPSGRSHKSLLSEPASYTPPASPPAAGIQPEFTDVQLEEIANQSRYPLRRRQAVQLQPYTVDKYNYKNSLKTNPDAIVKVRSPNRHNRHRHLEDRYEETQGDEYDAGDNEDAILEEQESRRRGRDDAGRWDTSRSPRPDEPAVVYPGLEDLPSEDEEEEEEMRKMSKEGKRIIKQRQRELKARERKEKEMREQERLQDAREREKKRPKAFPLSKRRNSRDASADEDDQKKRKSKRLKSITNEPPEGHDKTTSPHAQTPVFETRRSIQPALASPTVLIDIEQDDMDALRQNAPERDEQQDVGYFGQDDLTYYGPVGMAYDDPLAPVHDDILRNTRNTTIEISDNEDDSRSPSPDHEVAQESSPALSKSRPTRLDRKQQHALKRMMPAFMIPKALKGLSTDIQKNPLRRRSVTLSDSASEVEEAGPLRPGQTRVRLAANPKDPREIKGDSESSEDTSDDADATDTASVQSAPDDGIGQYHRPLRRTKGSSSESEGINDLRSKRRSLSHDSPNVIEISDDESSGSSEDDDGINDTEIQAYLRDDTPTVGRGYGKGTHPMVEKSLIDFMLSKTRMFNGKRSKQTSGNVRKKGVGSLSSRPKFDVVIGGARKHGRHRQSRLNFDERTSNISSGSKRGFHPRSSHSRKASVGRVSAGTDAEDTHSSKDQIMQISMSNEEPRKKSRKQQEKERKAHAKGQGLYTFVSGGGTRLESGRRRQTAPVHVTLDIDNEGLNMALAPASQGLRPQDWVKSFKPPPSRKGKRRLRSSPDPDPGRAEPPLQGNIRDKKKGKSKSARRDIQADLGIPFLHSGISFDGTTFIGRGMLYGLVNAVSSGEKPPEFSSCTILGFELAPLMGVPKLCSTLPAVCDGLLDFATGLPDPDSDQLAKEWAVLTRAVCQSVSWYHASSSEEDQRALGEIAEAEALRLADRIRKMSLNSSSMDINIFSACWFSVELAARAGCKFSEHSPRPSMNGLNDAAALLVQHLLDYGLHRTMQPVRTGKNLNESTLEQYTAELWVCLLHLTDACDSKAQQGNKHLHPFWTLVMKAFQSDTYLQKSDLQVSERIWTAIFGLSALSQFSVHGMTTNNPRLPACWEFIQQTLKKIRLAADPVADGNLPAAILDQRDRYIGIINARCFHLWDRWRWNLDEAPTSLFSQLADIFRTRKFGNLRHERSEIPLFFSEHNWDLLSVYSREDTAFVQLLKLLLHAANVEGTVVSKGELNPRAKKLLSLAIPLGSLPFTKATPPTLSDLSMLYNRYSAVAIALHLDPGQSSSRILQASSYIDFPTADDNTRLAVLRGMMNFAILMVKSKIKLDGIVIWTSKISGTLKDEYKAIHDAPMNLKAGAMGESQFVQRDRIFLNLQILFGCVRKIVQAHKTYAEYPEPGLLESLTCLLLNDRLPDVPKVAAEVQLLTVSYLDARAAVVPPPERPRKTVAIVSGTGQESQDLYGDADLDFDFSDPTLIAALDGGISTSESPVPDNAIKDIALRKAIHATRLSSLSWRFLRPYFTDPPNMAIFEDYAKKCDRWLYCWLGCVNLRRNVQPKAWDECMEHRNMWLKDNSEYWQQRIDLGFIFKLLQLDPMAYESYTKFAMEVLLRSLVTDHVTIENEYVAYVLSLNGLQHPLLRDIACVAIPENGDLQLSPTEFLEIRLPLLRGVFENLNHRRLHEASSDELFKKENIDYVGHCIQGLASMRNNVKKLANVGSDSHQTYVQWSREVFKLLLQYQELRLDPRFDFLISWSRTLG